MSALYYGFSEVKETRTMRNQIEGWLEDWELNYILAVESRDEAADLARIQFVIDSGELDRRNPDLRLRSK